MLFDLNGALLLCNCIYALCVFAWVVAFMAPYFMWLNYMRWLRVSQETEETGLDSSHHGGSAYYIDLSNVANAGAKVPSPSSKSSMSAMPPNNHPEEKLPSHQEAKQEGVEIVST